MSVNVLILEDDRGLNQGIALALKGAEYVFDSAYTIQEARKYWRERPADLVLLDVNLPDGSGYDFLEEIRRESQVPVIMITANDMEIDEVKGLSLGADDYITKPFSLMVLRARVERLMQRSQPKQMAEYQSSGYRFLFEQMFFSVEGQEITLSKTEQKLLRLFTANPGQILTREQLIDRIWTDGAEYVDENTLSVAVNRLRRKLETSKRKCPIQTVYGTGYVWEREE